VNHEDAADAARRLRVARLSKLMTPAEAEQYADMDADTAETVTLNNFLKDSDGVDFAAGIHPQPPSWGHRSALSPAARSAARAERYADPAEVRQAAYDRTRARLNGAADVRDGFAALRSLGENLGLPIGGIGHEIGPS
jgi:hypothetical protein